MACYLIGEGSNFIGKTSIAFPYHASPMKEGETMSKPKIDDVIANSQKIVDIWAANPTFSLGTLNLTDFEAALAALKQTEATVQVRRTELIGLIDLRDDQAKAMNDLVMRARSGILAVFGADSAQYEQAGRKRRSERKKPGRKIQAAE